METFSKIRDLDSETHDIFERNGSLIFELVQTDKVPKTGLTLLWFITKTTYIKEGIFELFESENL